MPEFQVVADGFRNVRRDRQAVIDYFVANPEIGSYELFATNPSGEKIKVASVLGGNVHILEPSMFVVATQKIDGIDRKSVV